MSELIQPKENREFTGSLGNWAGDMSWYAGPVGGKFGLMKFTCPPFGVVQSATLLFPYVKTLKDKFNDVTLGVYFPSPITTFIYTLYTITDGVYAYTGEWMFGITTDFWLMTGIAATIPVDWNLENTSLTFSAQNPGLIEYIFYADNASIQAQGRIDHLPVLGV